MKYLIMISSLLIILTGCGGDVEYKNPSESFGDEYLVGSIEDDNLSSEAIDLLNSPIDDEKVHVYEDGESIMFVYQKDNVIFNSERSLYQDYYFTDGANDNNGFYEITHYNTDYPELYTGAIEELSNYKFTYNDTPIDVEISEVDFDIYEI